MELARGIIDYAENDDGKGMRDAFYAALQSKVMDHIENHKMQVAKNLFASEEEIETEEQVDSDDNA